MSGEQFVDGFLEHQEMRGLLKDKIETGVLGRRQTGQHQHDGGGRAQLDYVGQLGAGHPGHGVIGDNQVVNVRIESSEGFFGVACGIHLVAEVVQEPLGRDSTIIIVIDQKDRL
jgi:hypothetical protein